MKYINIVGSWENEFGSAMELEEADVKTGIVVGVYSSHTGATGKYYLSGITDIDPSKKVNSQTIAFTISWRSFDPPSKEDAEGVNWLSAFSGQIQIVDKEEVMSTTYLLQRNTKSDMNWSSTIVATSSFKRKNS